MSKSKTPFVVNDTPTEKLPTSHLSKAQFGHRVYALMASKGWSQSELARRAGISRDRVSNYVMGKVMPSKEKLEALAEALGVPSTELLPNVVETKIDRDELMLEVKVSPHAPNSAWLRINRLVSLPTALKIAEILNNDEPLTPGK